MAKSSLSGMSVADLQRELKKRQRGELRAADRLGRKRNTLLSKLASIDAELAKLGHGAGRRGIVGRKRPRNEMNLADALAQVLSKAVMSVTEVAGEVQKAGYMTTSPSFRTIVNQTLIKDKRFKRVGRGKYTARK